MERSVSNMRDCVERSIGFVNLVCVFDEFH